MRRIVWPMWTNRDFPLLPFTLILKPSKTGSAIVSFDAFAIPSPVSSNRRENFSVAVLLRRSLSKGIKHHDRLLPRRAHRMGLYANTNGASLTDCLVRDVGRIISERELLGVMLFGAPSSNIPDL